MSAFIGPVHYWLYKKIQYQELINQRIMETFCPQIKEAVDQACNSFQEGLLEEIIDHQAIHQWLNNEVVKVEKRLTFILGYLTKDDQDSLKKLMFEAGKEVKSHEQYNDCLELFKIINNYLLDGMPCDKGISIITQDNNQVMYEYNMMVHEFIDFDILQTLRNEWVKGLIANDKIEYLMLNSNTYMLKMEE